MAEDNISYLVQTWIDGSAQISPCFYNFITFQMAGKGNESHNFDKGLKECHSFFLFILFLDRLHNQLCSYIENTTVVNYDLLCFILEGLIQAAIGKNSEILLVKGIKLELRGDKIDSRILVSKGILCLCFVNLLHSTIL